MIVSDFSAFLLVKRLVSCLPAALSLPSMFAVESDKTLGSKEQREDSERGIPDASELWCFMNFKCARRTASALGSLRAKARLDSDYRRYPGFIYLTINGHTVHVCTLTTSVCVHVCSFL